MSVRRTKSAVNARMLDEAAEWFVSFSESQVDPGSREQFSRWLRASPEHVRAYLQIAALWEDAALIDRQGRQQADELVQQALRADSVVRLGDLDSSRGGAPGLPRRGRAWWKIASAVAASVAVAALGTVLVLKLGPDRYATGVGEQRTISLADGSTIELNARSRLLVKLSKTGRRVELLDGQALFHVAQDSGRPFVVHAGTTEVQVLGTVFDIYRRDTDTTVTVIQGRVQVSEAQSAGAAAAHPERPVTGLLKHGSAVSSGTVSRRAPSVVLGAGEQATATGGALLTASQADVDATTAWVSRKLVFKAAPLDTVVNEFNRYSSRPLILRDHGLADIHISGVFSITDGASLVEFIRAQPNVQVHETDSAIEITTKEP